MSSLHLDARQRAMLQEMGLRVWTALPQSTPPAPSPALPTPPVAHTARAARPSHASTPPASSSAAPSTVPSTASPTGATWALLEPPRLLYPDADPAQTPPALGAGWLVVTEAMASDDPDATTADQLLHAMLRALQLHRHPRVAQCRVARAAAADSPSASAALAQQIALFEPAMVLVMGRGAVQAALGRSDPLAALRAAPLTLGGAPVVATYDPRMLLRQPQSKAAAWADLCRARALVQANAAAPMR